MRTTKLGFLFMAELTASAQTANEITVAGFVTDSCGVGVENRAGGE